MEETYAYELAVPLYRQEKEREALGVNLSRATMSNWIMTCYRDWLSPITKLLHEKLLEQTYLHADETPVQVLNEPGRKNTTDSYMWVYSSIKESKQPIRIFEYQPGKSGKHPEAFLKDFKGFIVGILLTYIQMSVMVFIKIFILEVVLWTTYLVISRIK